MKPSLCIFQVEASQWRRVSKDQFLPLKKKLWCQIFTEVDLKPVFWLSSPLWEASNRSVDYYYNYYFFFFLEVASHQPQWDNEWSLISKCISSSLCEYIFKKKNQHFFLLILLLPGHLVLLTFLLSARVHALWMCYNELSFNLHLGGQKRKGLKALSSPNRIST